MKTKLFTDEGTKITPNDLQNNTYEMTIVDSKLRTEFGASAFTTVELESTNIIHNR